MADGIPSRYHSHRRPRPSLEDVSSSPPAAEHDNLARSKSRYHRKQGTSAEPLPDTTIRPTSKHQQQQQQQQQGTPSRYHSKHRQPPLNTLYQEQIVETRPRHRRSNSNAKRYERERNDPPTVPDAQDHRRATNEDHDDERERVSSGRRKNPDQPPASSPPQSSSPPSQPTGELFPPPRPVEPPKLDGPPQSGNIRATKSMSELPKYDDDAEAGCFAGLFKRKRVEPASANPSTLIARPKPEKTEPIPAIKQGGVPGKDAPLSAINAGDRRVLIECGKSKTFFPITPTTTPVDLIKSAATCMSERIDVKSAILLECFNTVGVQRPLRRYEHVRDVMNSWDNDKQNSLILVDPGIGTVERELTITGVPTVEPDEQSWSLWYSQKVGKWDKRFITLRPSGQIICQKDLDKPNDAVNVCHLSDFDIYTPTPDKLKKKIKPPKKLCYAIKSQQKTSVFESTENFVHFFSAGDRETADSFYNAVQSWRSWYLVNVLGEGKKENEKGDAKPIASTATDPRVRSTSKDQAKTHRMKESMESHYQLGSFKPLIDMDQFDQGPSAGPSDTDMPGSSGDFTKSANQFDVNMAPERRASAAKRQHPPVPLTKKAQLAEDEPLANLNRQRSVANRRSSTEQRRPDTAEFRDTGLLGRNYSQRRREQSEREAQKQDPFIQGPNLLNRTTSQGADELENYTGGIRRQPSTRKQTSNTGDLKRSSSTRGGHNRENSIDLERSGTRRQKPKPLIDLTPEYKEPPQHAKKGRGYQPDQMKAGGLIADATTPEDPLGLPVSTVFRSASRSRGGFSNPGLIDLTPQHQEPIHHARKGRGYKMENAATGGGLVGSATTPEDPLGLPQSTVFRSMNAMPEGRRRAGSTSDSAQPGPIGTSVPKVPEAFTGEGLLASHKQGWGTETKGRGVIDGSHAAGKPLVDLSATTRFAGGSLLAKVEKADPIPAPIIDRERREERIEKYGEGY